MNTRASGRAAFQRLITPGSHTSAPVITISRCGKVFRPTCLPPSVIIVRRVETAIRWVIRSRAMTARMIAPAWTPRNWWTNAPSESGSSVSSIETSKWNGDRLNTRESGVKRRTSLWLPKYATRLPTPISTPLGAPVEPEVKMTYAGSSGPRTAEGRSGAGCRSTASSSARPIQAASSTTGSRSSRASTARGRSLPSRPRSRGSGWAASSGA